MINVNDIKTGMTLIIEGNIYQIVDFLHVKPGKGSAFMKTKLKNLRTGGTIERTFNTNVKFEKANINRSSVQYLYNTGDTYCFMNMETYEQLELSADQVGDDKNYLIENMLVDVIMYEGELLGLVLPDKVEFTVVETEPAVKGNTTNNALKDAYVETGLLVRVPLFIEQGEKILVTTSEDLAHKVSAEVDKFVAELSRKEIIQKSLDNYGYILVAKDIDEAVDVANEIASEHMEIVTKNPFDVMTKVKNAGAIFLGEYSSEPLGDYFAGPNHVLPTNGTAKFFSPLSVDDFIKKSSIISYSREALEPLSEDIQKFAKAEGLTAHANSIRVRFEEDDNIKE